MKRLALLALGAALSLPAFADTPGADWIPLEKAQQLLKAAGYTQVTKIKADDGQWEGEGLKTDGMKYDFHLDPHSGKITKEEMDM
ncbi:PepSY domain-containing protein [Pseudomonas sp. NPDC007930]|uniref:PepSY domain-containing protein n=1 Tax=Pseudomonas sp. NPDC007930 TaxID=3364417 RepID=UPI0036E2B069